MTRAGIMRSLCRPAAVTLCLWGALSIVPVDSATAQQEQEVRQASYTVSQAEAGREVYARACAACHLPNLRGSFEALALSGPDFLNKWAGQPTTELLAQIRRTMPPDTPRSLTDEDYAAVTAYLLQENAVPAGAGPLDFSSPGVVALAAADSVPADAADIELRPPVPGRPGRSASRSRRIVQ